MKAVASIAILALILVAVGMFAPRRRVASPPEPTTAPPVPAESIAKPERMARQEDDLVAKILAQYGVPLVDSVSRFNLDTGEPVNARLLEYPKYYLRVIFLPDAGEWAWALFQDTKTSSFIAPATAHARVAAIRDKEYAVKQKAEEEAGRERVAAVRSQMVKEVAQPFVAKLQAGTEEWATGATTYHVRRRYVAREPKVIVTEKGFKLAWHDDEYSTGYLPTAAAAAKAPFAAARHDTSKIEATFTLDGYAPTLASISRDGVKQTRMPLPAERLYGWWKLLSAR
jgi:hypothetical protein